MRDPNHVLPPGWHSAGDSNPRRHLNFGCFALDLDGRILIDPSGREVELRRREFDLLLTLARSPGRVMSRETLLDAIAGREAEAFDRTIDVYVGRLRRKIEADPKQPRLIVTVPGVGYRLAAKPRLANRQPDADQRSDEAAIHAGAGIMKYINKANTGCDAQASIRSVRRRRNHDPSPTGYFAGGQLSRKPTKSSTSGSVRTHQSSNMSWRSGVT